MRDLIHDIETYPNIMTATFLNVATKQVKVFEMSPWKSDWAEFRLFTKNCSNGFVRWVGFNNFYFDYQVIHHLMMKFANDDVDGLTIAEAAYDKAQELFAAGKDEKFQHIVWDNNHLVPQVDLYRIHHFDNLARSTSLKEIEFNMRSKTIEDLPFDPKYPIEEHQRAELIHYNEHDVQETYKFYLESLDMIRFREELTEKLGKNFLNHNDTKIGKDFFIMELEKADIKCYTFDDDGRQPVQTLRDRITIRDVIFPYIKFDRPEFNAVLNWLKRQVITQTKGVFTEIDDLRELEQYANLKKVKGKVKNLNCVIDGFQFDFGTGGIHGSIEPTIISECDEYAILDYDVTSLYPSIAIVNEIFPKHLTRRFCSVYSRLKDDRMSYAKGTPENAMLKLALNGVYGDSNNPYSVFYDPQYTMAITINGQLMLCMLAEMYMDIKGLKILQINTDGVTIKVPRSKVDEVERLNVIWSHLTKLDLERADYSRMFIRDCNNYIGEYTDGKLKRKGAYEYDIEWHQNHSALVVQKAVEAHIVRGVPIRAFIEDHTDTYDFMLRAKIPRSSRLMWGDEQTQNVTRYFMSTDGKPLVKIMPPNPKKLELGDRHFKQHIKVLKTKEQWNVTVMNTMGDVKNIDYDWYVKEAQKLITPLQEGMLLDMLV
jgi:hypothetical protein